MTQTQEDSSKEETIVAIPDRLVQNFLKQAQVALDGDNLAEAHKRFEEALEVKGSRSDRETAIRQELKQYSEQLTQRTPADWDLAHRALNLLGTLDLQDEQTHQWQRDLWLKQANFLLEQEDLDKSFKIFDEVMTSHEQAADQESLKDEISRLVRVNILRLANQHQWALLGQVIERVQSLWPPSDGLHDWLGTISQALAAAAQAPAEYQTKIEQLTHELENGEQEQRRLKNIIYALSGIMVIAAVIYLIFIIIPLLQS